MLYNYTVTLQQSKHAPRRFELVAPGIKEVFAHIRKTMPFYKVRAIVRKPK